MHAFLTAALHSTSNQFAVLAAQDNTDSNASAVCSQTSLPPPLSPISKTSMHMATDDGGEYISQRFYALLAAVSQLGTNTPPSSTAQDTNTTPDSLKGDTNRGVSVKLENTGTNDIQEVLQNLNFKCTCICQKQEQEEEKELQRGANQQKTRSRSRRSQSCMPTQKRDGSSPPVTHSPSLMIIVLSPRPITTNFTLTIPSTPLSAPPLAGDIQSTLPSLS